MELGNELKNGAKRYISLDVGKIIAICLVIMIHCSAGFVGKIDSTMVGFAAGNIFDSVARAGVPLFLMISGALALNENKEKSMGKVFGEIKNFVFLIVVWSIIYAVFYEIILPILLKEKIYMGNFIKAIIDGHFHLWYLYMLIGLRVATPFLRCFVKEKNSKLVLFYILISLMFEFIKPVIRFLAASTDMILYVNDFLDKFHMEFFTGYIAYYLAGWYIFHIGLKKGYIKKLIYILGGLSLISIIVLTQITKEYNNTYDILGVLVFAYSISIFVLINDIKLGNTDNKTSKIICGLSKLSFGVYITHIIVNTFAGALVQGLNPVAHICLRFVFVVVVSFGGCHILSKIPGVKKLIKM